MNQVTQALREDYAAKCQRNARYSLRQYARLWGISPSLMSLILSEKRAPSRKVSELVEKRLGRPISATVRQLSRHELANSAYATIADWIPFAILSLLKLPGFRFEAHWIAKRLAVTAFQATKAMAALRAAKLICETETGWEQAVPPLSVANKRPMESVQAHVRSLLRKAGESMDFCAFEERNLTHITFAMNRKDVAWASDKITAFRRELCQALEERSTPDAVYTLAVQLFPLTQTPAKPTASRLDHKKEERTV